MINWKHVQHFERKEFDDPRVEGSGDFMDGQLVHMLDKMRSECGWAIITHQKVGGCVDLDGSHGHAPASYHLKLKGCKAVDFHFADPSSFKPLTIDARIQYAIVEQYRFMGIGIYYDWYWAGKFLPIGFHVDLRPLNKIQRWKRIGGRYIYLLGRDQ